MNRILTLLLIIFFPFVLSAQVDFVPAYKFENDKSVECTRVKSQGKTGTCWSFATASFLESETMKMGHSKNDFSEMFVVRNIYLNKAQNYVLRQGKAQFSQGSLSHDLIKVAEKNGMIPEAVFSGLNPEEKTHNHAELSNILSGMLNGLMKGKILSPKWMPAVKAVLNVYLGEVPTEFEYEGKKYTPKSYSKSLGIEASNYINFTSFTHHPFYESFILEIPDNYSNGEYYNIPINSLSTLVDQAINAGYSVAWDGDVSEKGFSQNHGLAILPQETDKKKYFITTLSEKNVTQEIRQAAFESVETTDDHLMHLVGTAKDQKGNKYYLIKNSWGEKGPYKGYLYMSEAYFKMKTISIMLNKNAIGDKLRKELKLEEK